jgi:hypothetical protein
LVAAGLMLAGAAVHGFGIRNPKRPTEEPAEAEPQGPREERAEGVPAARRVDTIPEDVPCLPVPQPTALPGDARMHHESGGS